MSKKRKKMLIGPRPVQRIPQLPSKRGRGLRPMPKAQMRMMRIPAECR